MESQRFRSLSAHYRALVAVAVLLDGQDAGKYLAFDQIHGDGISRAASDLAGINAEVRLPLVANLLRVAVSDLGESKE